MGVGLINYLSGKRLELPKCPFSFMQWAVFVMQVLLAKL